MITRALQSVVFVIVLTAGIWYTFCVPATLSNVATVSAFGTFLFGSVSQIGQVLDAHKVR